MEKIIKYCGQDAKIACDEKCHKAWGMNSRPAILLELGEGIVLNLDEDIHDLIDDSINIDNYAYLSDDELDDAPVKSDSSEGGDYKPTSKAQIPNKWCVRECERCTMSMPNQSHLPLKLKDFSKRRYNFPPHVRD